MRHGELVWQTALVAASTALFVLIILATLTTSWAEALSDEQRPLSWWARVDFGNTLIAVRVLQGVLTAASTAAMSNSFMRLHWNKISRDKGLPLADLLALSPTTSLMGTARLIAGKHTKLGTRVGAFARLCLTTFPWLAGILLFARTSLVTVFDTALVYDVTSGIGPFNASYVDSFINAFQDQDTFPPTSIVPYAYSSVVHNLIANSLLSTVAKPVLCESSERDLECASYIISGGLSLAAPWTPVGNPDHPLVRIKDVPTIQTEFQGRYMTGPSPFSDTDCLFFGSNRSRIAADFCLSASAEGQMHAGLFLCDGLDPTVSKSRKSYRTALSWLLDYSAANIPAPSSILEIFWDNQDNLSDPYTEGILLQNFRSILAFPIWLFNANNYGNPELNGKVLNPGLPPEFYTEAAVVSPLVKLHFDGTLLKVFIVLEGIVLLTLWAGILLLFAPWSSGAGLVMSSFPAMDFFFKADVVDAGGPEVVDGDGVLERAGGVTIYAAGRRRKEDEDEDANMKRKREQSGGNGN
ncbi:hypothetical protein QBC34DRAFT_472396 [Podospora aff. communis PSN243]|uniref:Uncharacterized protein n=1 Tax=Podospora aff. communis PSN243 TaxID=3040156 RepID=A0AAV9GBJ4_9PEZI|nr:hypothetical protein QBC34DRAFT_472396 [Podospora aff. communis PSN243]